MRMCIKLSFGFNNQCENISLYTIRIKFSTNYIRYLLFHIHYNFAQIMHKLDFKFKGVFRTEKEYQIKFNIPFLGL